MGVLADSIRQNWPEIERVLRVGFASYPDLLEKVERQEAEAKRDFYDEQIWTFLICCGYALTTGGPTRLAELLLGGGTGLACQAIWFECQPRSPRYRSGSYRKEGSSRIDLALGALRQRDPTRSGMEYDPALGRWVAFCECKWYSDISTTVSYDQHRNQFLRVIDSALFLQTPQGERPGRVHVVLVTPASFRSRKIKSRLYQYKFEEYQTDPQRIKEELEACRLERSESYPDLDRCLQALRLHWVTYQDLLHGLPESPIQKHLIEFVRKSDGSGDHC